MSQGGLAQLDAGKRWTVRGALVKWLFVGVTVAFLGLFLFLPLAAANPA